MRSWRRWLAVCAVVAAAGAATAGDHGPDATAAAVPEDAAAQSAELAAAGDLPTADGSRLDGPRAAVAAGDLAARVPVPAGGNLNGIRWTELEGTIGAQDVQAVVEYNAACQWYRALRDGRQTAEARRVIADIPRWQATRDRGTGELAAAVAGDVASGGGEALTGVLRDCDAAHKREAEFARATGRAPGA